MAVMQLSIGNRKRLFGPALLVVGLIAASAGRAESDAGAPAAASSGAKVPIVWQHHRVKFSYVGYTTLYACDALESQVSRILKYLGARADVKVTASCSRPVLPAHDAVIDADFYAPVLADGGAAAEAGMGQWTPVGLESGHPNFIEPGDCELIQGMKDLVTRNFTLRNFDYSTSCFPNQLTPHDFAVKGEALKVSAPTPG
jgi:hypothetical protein